MTYRYISNFARTKGAKDKQERKRRNVGGYVAGAGAAGAAGLAGLGAGAYYGGDRILKKAVNIGGKKGTAMYRLSEAARNKIKKGGLAAGLAGAGVAAGLGAKAYLNSRSNKADAARDARNKARYEGSLAGRSKAAVRNLKQKASDIRSGAASKYQRAKQRAKDTYNRAFPKYE